jgi:hypothetical protein
VDYNNEDAVLGRTSGWSRNSSNSLCLDARNSAFALAASVSSRSHAIRAEQPLKFTHRYPISQKTGSDTAHSRVSSNSQAVIDE